MGGLKIMKSFSSQAVMTGESLAGLVACVARFVLFGLNRCLCCQVCIVWYCLVLVASVAIPQNTDFQG